MRLGINVLLVLLLVCTGVQAASKTVLNEEDIGLINAHRFGPTPTEATDATVGAAIADASTLNKSIYLAPGAWDIVNSLTVPSTRGLHLAPGTTVTVEAGKTLTILGALYVAPGASFAGAGTVDYSNASCRLIPGSAASFAGNCATVLNLAADYAWT